MFEKIISKFFTLYTIEVTCDRSIDKAFYVYDFIQSVLDDPSIPTVTCWRKASFDITLGKFRRGARFVMNWKISARKCDIDDLFKELAVYKDRIADKVDSTETVYIKLNNVIVSTF